MSSKKRRLVWIIVAIILLGATGGGYAYYRQTKAVKAQAQATQQTLQMTRVRRGEIVLSATGAGSVTAVNDQVGNVVSINSAVLTIADPN